MFFQVNMIPQCLYFQLTILYLLVYRIWKHCTEDILGPVGVYCVCYTRNPPHVVVFG